MLRPKTTHPDFHQLTQWKDLTLEGLLSDTGDKLNSKIQTKDGIPPD